MNFRFAGNSINVIKKIVSGNATDTRYFFSTRSLSLSLSLSTFFAKSQISIFVQLVYLHSRRAVEKKTLSTFVCLSIWNFEGFTRWRGLQILRSKQQLALFKQCIPNPSGYSLPFSILWVRSGLCIGQEPTRGGRVFGILFHTQDWQTAAQIELPTGDKD